ncbi:MAG: nucleotidyl transferase AbiEii/AbiGii toxin family protein [Peptococcaceae bacterium]|jgi:hypothetical protein|nr:nucleotidyl transferase AbiEii/AbiGii toxin family protein [Peptococcaceae bacterium]
MVDAAWEDLFDKAVACLDNCSNEMPSFVRWSLGGGTALMMHLFHRRSKDIDIFINYAEMLPLLSPRLNAKSDALASDYIEAQNFVKLKLPQGEIDFIVGPHLTSDPWLETDIRGRMVLLETPWEIVTKKLFYRASTLQTRDVFDVAAVLHHYPKEVHRSIDLLQGKFELLQNRLNMIRSRYKDEAIANINVLPAGEPFLHDAPGLVSKFLDFVQEREKPQQQYYEPPDRNGKHSNDRDDR